MTNSYRSESLGMLEAYITDAINSDATPKEVYDTLINTVKEEIKYHKRVLVVQRIFYCS